jgi:hypothetical protein
MFLDLDETGKLDVHKVINISLNHYKKLEEKSLDLIQL